MSPERKKILEVWDTLKHFHTRKSECVIRDDYEGAAKAREEEKKTIDYINSLIRDLVFTRTIILEKVGEIKHLGKEKTWIKL